MIIFDLNSQVLCQDLMIAIYWIGYSVNQDHFKFGKKLESKFKQAGLKTSFDNELEQYP